MWMRIESRLSSPSLDIVVYLIFLQRQACICFERFLGTKSLALKKMLLKIRKNKKFKRLTCKLIPHSPHEHLCTFPLSGRHHNAQTMLNVANYSTE